MNLFFIVTTPCALAEHVTLSYLTNSGNYRAGYIHVAQNSCFLSLPLFIAITLTTYFRKLINTISLVLSLHYVPWVSGYLLDKMKRRTKLKMNNRSQNSH